MNRTMVARSLALIALLAPIGCFGDNGMGGDPFAGVYLGGPAPLAAGGFDYNLSIFHTNDIHDQVLPVKGIDRGGMARQATLMRLLKEQAAARGVAMLTANGGDNFEGTLFYDTDGGVLLMRILEEIGYDAIQVGNHDHQFGAQRLYDVMSLAYPGFTQSSRFIWGNANPSEMSPLGTDPALVNASFLPAQVHQNVIDAFENSFVDFVNGTVDPTLMDAPLSNSKIFNQTLFYDREGIRVGVFGLDTDEVIYSPVPGQGELFINADDRAENMMFYSPVTHSFASDMITYLDDPDGDPMTDDGADVIVCVTHLGLHVDTLMAQSAVGATGRRIDVVVGGHSHTKLNRAVDVDHGNGQHTWIVQAKSRGEYVGRIDLLVDPASNTVQLKNAELIQVDSSIPEDPVVKEMVRVGIEGPGGVDATFGNATTTVLGTNDQFLPGGLPTVSSLGNLAADGVLDACNQPPLNLNVDAALVGNFVFRADLFPGPVTPYDVQSILPLHFLDRNGVNADAMYFVDLPGGIRVAQDPSTFPLPTLIPAITATEYFLEIIFGVSDLLASIGSFLGLDVGNVDEFIQGIQWAGIEFVVDGSAPALHRIDPASIFINGVPLVGNESVDHRIVLNGVISELAMPFIQLLTALEEPIGSGILMPFPAYDSALNATGLPVWEGLESRVATLGVLDAAAVRIHGNRPRTMGPDLAFNTVDAVVPGDGQSLGLTILNIGEIDALSCDVVVTIDPTPNDTTDDPDGHTDSQTGFAFPVVGGVTSVGAVSGFSSGVAGTLALSIALTLPAGLPPGDYPLFVSIQNVASGDLTRPETRVDNNGGLQFPITLHLN